MKQMQDVASTFDCSVIAVMDVPHDQVSNYGIVVGDEIETNVLQVSSMVEKPRWRKLLRPSRSSDDISCRRIFLTS